MELFDYLSSKLKALQEQADTTIEHQLAAIDAHIDDFLAEVKQGLINNPEPVFALLRCLKPILLVKNYALVTRFADVQEVLSRDGVFQQLYAKKMALVNHGMNYILGMENSPDYTRDKSNIWQTMPRQEIPGLVSPMMEQAAREVVAASNGELDIVLDLFQGVQLQLLRGYFGIAIPERDTFFATLFDISRYIFGDFGDDPQNQERAVAAGKVFNQILLDSIAAAKLKPNPATILGRFIKMQQDGVGGCEDENIRANLFGTILGAITAPSVTFTCALDFLISRQDAWQALQQAALADDDTTICRFIHEAYRFKPMTPGWFRYTAQDYIVAKGTARATLIPKGSITIALTQSAMMDDDILDEPDQIRLDRPDHHYMVYAWGIHECMGKYISDTMMTLALKPLLQQANVRRAPGESGQIHTQGGFPNGFRVCFG